MAIIKLKVNGYNSTFVSQYSNKSDAIIEMINTIKKVFGECKYKILDIYNIEKLPIKQDTSYLYRTNKTKMLKTN